MKRENFEEIWPRRLRVKQVELSDERIDLYYSIILYINNVNSASSAKKIQFDRHVLSARAKTPFTRVVILKNLKTHEKSQITGFLEKNNMADPEKINPDPCSLPRKKVPH